jgi:hypothetical protein
MSFSHLSALALAEARAGNPLRYIEEEILACSKSPELVSTGSVWWRCHFVRNPFPNDCEDCDALETWEMDCIQYDSFEEAVADGPLAPGERIELSAARKAGRSTVIGTWNADRSVDLLRLPLHEICPALPLPELDGLVVSVDGPELTH